MGGARPDPRDMFSDLFRQFETPGRDEPRTSRASPIPAGEDIELEAAIALEDVVAGGSRRITLPDGRAVEVNIPKGAANGATLRLRGQGHPSPFGGPNGDVRVTLRYQRHPRFVVDGQDLRLSVAVPIRDAVLGGAIRVPTLQGEVEVTVPAWTSGGKTLRLRGKGLPVKDGNGDLFVSLDIDLGPPDPEMEGFFRRRRA
jgi:DnaJ-class molecular chaperone